MTEKEPTSEDLRAIYSAASHYLRSLYADQPSPHATKDNAVRLARIAESLHTKVAHGQVNCDRLHCNDTIGPCEACPHVR